MRTVGLWSAISVVSVSVAAMFAVIPLAPSSTALAAHTARPPIVGQAPAEFEADSTQAVCGLTGKHGEYKEFPSEHTITGYGVASGDSGSSFEFEGQVWWLFGNSGATTENPWGPLNASTRWPEVEISPGTPLASQDPAALGSDSIATSPAKTPPPPVLAPYNDTEMPPNEPCPELSFIRQTPGQGAYANPSVTPDPMFGEGYLSLRSGELPEAGISEGDPAHAYVVFGTDNPANCVTLGPAPGPCIEPSKEAGPSKTCENTLTGSRTRSVMARYVDGSPARFEGLYDLSEPASRYGPLCHESPRKDTARFVNVQMADGKEGFVYIWGTEGGANDGRSPVYLARILATNIATGKGIQYWKRDHAGAGFVSEPQRVATPLFKDHPTPCVSQLGIQYNVYLSKWIMLYRCTETPAPPGHPNGIYMRTAKNPWGPWSSATTVFDPEPDQTTRSGYCYFIYSTQTESTKNPSGSPSCPSGSLNKKLGEGHKPHVGGYYGPYFVANWTRGTTGSSSVRASTTIYYTLDTFDPYGQLIMRSTILGPPLPPKKPIVPCKGTSCT